MAVAPATFKHEEARGADYLSLVPEIETVPEHSLSHVLALGGLLTGTEFVRFYRGLLHHEGSPLPVKDRFFPPPHRGLSSFEEMNGELDERITVATERLGGPVALFGHSLGGHFAQRYALNHPDRVDSVTVAGSIPVKGLKSLTPLGHVLKAALRSAKGKEDIMQGSDYMRRHAHEVATLWPPDVPLHLVTAPSDELVPFADGQEAELPPGQTAKKVAVVMRGPLGLLINSFFDMNIPDDARVLQSYRPVSHFNLQQLPNVLDYHRGVRSGAAERAGSLVLSASTSSRPKLVSVTT